MQAASLAGQAATEVRV